MELNEENDDANILPGDSHPVRVMTAPAHLRSPMTPLPAKRER